MRRLSSLGAPSAIMRNIIGYGMVAPTIATHGTDEQKSRFLRPCSPAKRSGVSCSPSPARDRTWRRWRLEPSATAMSGS
jgi:hypothetical protein